MNNNDGEKKENKIKSINDSEFDNLISQACGNDAKKSTTYSSEGVSNDNSEKNKTKEENAGELKKSDLAEIDNNIKKILAQAIENKKNSQMKNDKKTSVSINEGNKENIEKLDEEKDKGLKIENKILDANLKLNDKVDNKVNYLSDIKSSIANGESKENKKNANNSPELKMEKSEIKTKEKLKVKRKKQTKLKIILSIACFLIVIFGFYGYYMDSKNIEYEYLVIYLNDEYSDSYLEELKNLKNIEEAYYMSKNEVYEELKTRISSSGITILYNEDDFSNIIIAKIKKNSESDLYKTYISDIENKAYVSQVLCTENIYDSIMMDTFTISVCMSVENSNDNYEKSYDDLYETVSNFDGVYDVKKVTKEELLEEFLESIETDGTDFSKLKENNTFPDIIMFKISSKEYIEEIENLLDSIIESDENIDYCDNLVIAKNIMSEMKD